MAIKKKGPERHTQAVVIIHGIGEQRPMSTLRGFVEAVLPARQDGEEKYFSKPDALSESFELRKLQDRSQPRTHFYEYYWAYKVEGTKYGHVWAWLSMLLFRRPKKVPKQLRSIWWLSWFLIVVAGVSMALGFNDTLRQLAERLPAFLVSLGSMGLLALVQIAVLNFIGDAARYLSPRPENIKLRQTIRSDGIKLLKKIHEDGEYERIIVVGHSLGSVIAYDILIHLWQEYYQTYLNPHKTSQPALSRVESLGSALQTVEPAASLPDYLDAKVSLWKELRGLGNPWLVTDLVTLGSPLAHAAMLLADDTNDLHARQRQRELPADPPIPEIDNDGIQRYAFRLWDLDGKPNIYKLRAIHHAGLFACTRWTNLYFPAALGIFGDIVGGPLGPWFGPGVRDIPVNTGNWVKDHSILAHTTYWHTNRAGAGTQKGSVPLALKELVAVLDLDNKSYFEND
jgi:hypothetical protein